MDMTRRFPRENAGLPHPDNQDRLVHDVHTDCNVDERGHTILEISCQFSSRSLSFNLVGRHYDRETHSRGSASLTFARRFRQA
jgi:hypothetical protein